MTDGARVTVTGLSGVLGALTAIGRDLDDPRAARRTARLTALRIRAELPVDTGELRDSVTVQDTPGGAAVTVGAPHAAAVEYGTGTTPPRPVVRRARTAAQPVLRAAAAAQVAETIRRHGGAL